MLYVCFLFLLSFKVAKLGLTFSSANIGKKAQTTNENRIFFSGGFLFLFFLQLFDPKVEEAVVDDVAAGFAANQFLV